MLQVLREHFQDGGWAMWLVFAFGTLATGGALRFAWRGHYQLRSFIRWQLLTLVACGIFGFLTGMLKVLSCATSAACRELHQETVSGILLIGTREALNVPTATAMFVLVISLLTAVGYRRFPQPNPSAAPR